MAGGRANLASPYPRLGPKSRWHILEIVASGRIFPLSSLMTFDHRKKAFLSGSENKAGKIGLKHMVKSSHSPKDFLVLMAIRSSLRVLLKRC